MNETKKRIIEAAITLITEKGFHGTSIQDIAAQAGISKGAFYLHFKSKDALQVETFRYYTSLIQEAMEKVADPDLEPEDNYRGQLETQIVQLQRHTDFILMIVREQAFSPNPELIRFIEELRMFQADWYRDQLTAMYGDAVLPFIHDIAAVAEGIKAQYLQQFLSNPQALSPVALAELIVLMTRQAAEGFLNGTFSPLLDDNTVRTLCSGLFPKEETLAEMTVVIEAMRTTLFNLELPGSTSQYLAATLDFLETQANVGSGADRTAIQGALSVFHPYPEFGDRLHELKERFGLTDELSEGQRQRDE